MNWALFLRMMLTRLWRFKRKSLAMMAGIIISVAAIILVQTIGINVKAKFTQFIRSTYPANTIYLAAGDGFMGGGRGYDKLKLEDVEAILTNVDGISQWDPIVFASMNMISSGSRNAYVSVMGHSELAEQVRSRSVTEGEYFDADAVRRARQVALIGPTAARALFGSESPIGQTVFYNNVSIEVIGLLESAGVDPHGRDLDNELHLPYTLLKDKILARNNISGVTFSIDEAQADIELVARQIIDIMREQHHLSGTARNDFTVIHSGIMLQMVDKAYRIFDIFVPLTTFIAFFISGVVTSSVMLAVVRERTSEIGLRKALGATPADLRLLILLEVLLLSFVAAVIGVALAQLAVELLTPLFATKFGILSLQPSFAAIGVSLLLALTAGVLGAMLPAKRAADLHPAVALA